MRHLENTGLFILSGFFFLFFRKLDYFFVCAFLLCLCLCCTSYFAQSKRLHLVLCTAFIAAAFLIPELFLFFPAVFYVLLLDQYHVPALVCSVLYFYGIWSEGKQIPLFPSGESSCFSWLFVCKTAQKPQNVWNKVS